MDKKIVVSIVVLTYNHEQYIREALDSILMQQVDFKYEIVVGDDCSTDETRVILESYERNFPGLFKVSYRVENIGTTKNSYDVFMHCKGKYIAQLEGDDYWNDPYKLQTQVQFLEANEIYIGVAHSCNVLCDDIALKEKLEAFYSCEDGTAFKFDDYKKKRFAGHTCTLVYKNIYSNGKLNYNIIHEADKFIGDQTINLLLVMQGIVYCMDTKMSTYRLVRKVGASNFVSQSLEANTLKQRWNYLKKLNEYCMYNGGESFIGAEIRTEDYWLNSLKVLIKNPNRINYQIFAYFTKMIVTFPAMLIHIPTCILKEVKARIRIQK